MYLTCSFPHLPQYDWILLLMNLHFCSSFSTWMIFHGISCLLCLLLNQYSLTTWWKFLHSLLSFSLSLFIFLVEIFSRLMAFSFSHSLIPPQNLISPWWILFSELDESSYFELVILFSLSPLRTIPSGVESIRSTLPHLEI